MSYNVISIIQVLQILAKESERILLALQDSGLDKGNYPYFSRALDNAIGAIQRTECVGRYVHRTGIEADIPL